MERHIRRLALAYDITIRQALYRLQQPYIQHLPTHQLDLAVATVAATGQIVDFCYDCDDFITRSDNSTYVGIDAHAARYLPFEPLPVSAN